MSFPVLLAKTHDSPAVEAQFPDFHAFVDAMRQSRPVIEDKLARPVFHPYLLAPEARGRRALRYVTEYRMLAFDCDHATVATIHSLAAKLAPFEFWIYPTWSYWDHAPRELRFRLVIPIPKPVGPIRYLAHHRRTAAYLLSQEVDKSTLDSLRIYYGPCTKPEHQGLYFDLYNPGLPFDPESLPNVDFVSRDSLLRWAKKLALGNARQAAVGRAIHDGLTQDAPLAIDGQKNEFCFNLGLLLTRSPFPNVDPKSIADILAVPWSRTAPDDPHYLLTTLERVMRDRLVRESEGPSHLRNFWASHGDPDRSDPYLPTELAKIREPYEDTHPPWILVSNDGFAHFLTHKGYGTGASPSLASARALHELAPAPVRLYDDDQTPIPWPFLVANPAVTATKVRLEYSMHPIERQYDHRTNVLTLCLTPLRDVGPAQIDPWFQGYLETLAGPELPTLLTWLSWLPDTREALAGLFLHGDKDSGKNFFAWICSRLWSTSGPSNLHRILGKRFNDLLLHNPFTFADEYFPRDDRGKQLTEDYRAFIGTPTNALELKRRDIVQIHGYPRAYFAANDDDLLRMGSDHSSESLSAISERLCTIEVKGGRAREYLRAAPPGFLREFVESDRGTRHILALARTRESTNLRYKVKPLSNRAELKMMLGSGLVDGILYAAWLYLSSNRQLPGWLLANGCILVKTQALFDGWRSSCPTHLPPKSVGALGRALSSISGPRITPSGASEKYHPINPDKLAQWAEGAGLASPGDVASLLAKPPRLAVVQNFPSVTTPKSYP